MQTSSQALIDRDAASVAATIYRYTDIAFQRGEGVYLYDYEGRFCLRDRHHECRALSPTGSRCHP